MPGSSAALSHDATFSPQESGTHPFVDSLRRLPGRILVSWSVAGGVVAGGLLIAATTLAGRMSSSTVPQLSTLLFVLGAAAGAAHGGLLGYLSRDPGRTRRDIVACMLRALVWLIPALLVSWAAALWISLTAAVLRGSEPSALVLAGLALGWTYGVAVCGWALVEGVRGLVAAYRRWPDLRLASLAISLVFAVLVTVFLTSPPEIWFTDVRVTDAGAVILAFGASVWIALPVVIAALGLLHRASGRD